MTSAHLIEDIKADEGCRLVSYPDPLTHGEPWTIGYGCTGVGIGPNTKWSQAQAEAALGVRVKQCETQLDHAFPWWRALDDTRQDVLVNMTYNMGIGGLSGFQHTLAAIKASHWDEAAAQMLSSHWAAQVPTRAKRLALQMQTGERA